MPTSVTATISPLIQPSNKPTPVRASSAAGIRQWLDPSNLSNRLPGANTLAKDMEDFAKSINGILTLLKQAQTLVNLSSIINSEVQITNGTDSITLDPISDTMIITNGVNVTVIDPRGPSLTMVTGTGGNKLTFTLVNSVITIAGTGSRAGQGNITIDGVLTAATATVSALNAASAILSGALTAGTAAITGLLNAGSISTGNMSATSITASGSPGITVTATVRNAAGSGTSTMVYTDGILTSYTP